MREKKIKQKPTNLLITFNKSVHIQSIFIRIQYALHVNNNYQHNHC